MKKKTHNFELKDRVEHYMYGLGKVIGFLDDLINVHFDKAPTDLESCGKNPIAVRPSALKLINRADDLIQVEDVFPPKRGIGDAGEEDHLDAITIDTFLDDDDDDEWDDDETKCCEDEGDREKILKSLEKFVNNDMAKHALIPTKFLGSNLGEIWRKSQWVIPPFAKDVEVHILKNRPEILLKRFIDRHRKKPHELFMGTPQDRKGEFGNKFEIREYKDHDIDGWITNIIVEIQASFWDGNGVEIYIKTQAPVLIEACNSFDKQFVKWLDDNKKELIYRKGFFEKRWVIQDILEVAKVEFKKEKWVNNDNIFFKQEYLEEEIDPKPFVTPRALERSTWKLLEIIISERIKEVFKKFIDKNFIPINPCDNPYEKIMQNVEFEIVETGTKKAIERSKMKYRTGLSLEEAKSTIPSCSDFDVKLKHAGSILCTIQIKF